MKCQTVLLFSLLVVSATVHAQNQRDLAIRADKETLAADDFWFYDELEPAFDEAARTNRPLMIVFR